MKPYWLILVVGFVSVAAGCNTPDGIPLVGLDENNNPLEVTLTQSEYTRRLGGAVALTQESTLPALSRRTAGKPWLLRTAVVGLGVSAEVGIGPFKVSALPKFRLAFTNSTDPTLP